MSPDGGRMVVNGPGHRVRLLDVDKQEYVGNDSNTPWGESPAYAPDGSRCRAAPGSTRSPTDATATGLVIASTDGRTWTADTRTDLWVQRACAIAGRNLTGDEGSQFFPRRPYEPTCPQ